MHLAGTPYGGGLCGLLQSSPLVYVQSLYFLLGLTVCSNSLYDTLLEVVYQFPIGLYAQRYAKDCPDPQGADPPDVIVPQLHKQISTLLEGSPPLGTDCCLPTIDNSISSY